MAVTRRVRALTGRAVEGAGHVPYRPLVEALLAATRIGIPKASALAPFLPALAALVPGWAGSASSVDPNPVVVAEGVLRLLAGLGEQGGTLLAVEDLHWADPETLSVVEYLADHVGGESILVVVTIRSESPSEALARIHQLLLRRVRTELRLSRLERPQIEELAYAVAGGTLEPEALDTIVGRSEGVPLLVEELVVAAADQPVGATVPKSLTWDPDNGFRLNQNIHPQTPAVA